MSLIGEMQVRGLVGVVELGSSLGAVFVGIVEPAPVIRGEPEEN